MCELSISPSKLRSNSLPYLYFEVFITIVCQLFKFPKEIYMSENFMSGEKFQLPEHLLTKTINRVKVHFFSVTL